MVTVEKKKSHVSSLEVEDFMTARTENVHICKKK